MFTQISTEQDHAQVHLATAKQDACFYITRYLTNHHLSRFPGQNRLTLSVTRAVDCSSLLTYYRQQQRIDSSRPPGASILQTSNGRGTWTRNGRQAIFFYFFFVTCVLMVFRLFRLKPLILEIMFVNISQTTVFTCKLFYITRGRQRLVMKKREDKSRPF